MKDNYFTILCWFLLMLAWVAIPFSRGSPQPRDQTQLSRIAGGFFITEPPGKPKNTGVVTLYLLQQIFPTQESNRGLLHCRQILYQLSHQGSPKDDYFAILCWFLLYIDMNQSQVYIWPLPLNPPSHLPSHCTPLGCHRAWV